MIRWRTAAWSLLPLASLLGVAAAAARPLQAPEFTRDVLPILEQRCWSCHAAGEQKGGLRLDTRAAALKGGHAGPAILPGKAAASHLIQRISSKDPQTLMPPGKPLEPEQIALLKRWIDQGAKWDAAALAESTPKTHWSFTPPVRPALPAVRDTKWARNPVDRFILAELEKRGLRPSPPADRPTLLRRVTLDLTGLPPTPDELRAFEADRAPDAYEKVVRRLLASPQYGERWAQHWLDVVRFGETNGFELDGDRPQAWRYRDYVVKALNEDRPYDRFLQEQIAGDEIDPQSFELRVATGFLRAGPQHVVGGNQDAAMLRQEWLTEAVAGVGNGVLGLTVGCARCHDHKFDPIPQADYYRLQAFFAGTENQDRDHATPEQKQAHQAALQALKARAKPIQDQISAIERPYRERLRKEKQARLDPQYATALAVEPAKRTPEQKRLAGLAEVQLRLEWIEVVAALTPADRERRAALRKQLHALDLEAPQPPPVAPGVGEKEKTPPTHILVRGEPHDLGAEVQPGFPTALALPVVAENPCATAPPAAKGRRTELAQWLTRPDHPLTARVMANRLWHHHFGRGLVATPNDFGRNGLKPTHPALLDWLAVGFATGDWGPRLPKSRAWSLKHLHYLIVTSATYQQTSTWAQPNPQSAIRNPQSVDPQNHLLWRMNPRRLDAEALRDSVIAAAGTLNPEAGGPSVRVPLEPEVYEQIFTEGEPDNLWPVTPDVRQHTRRSLYLLRKRNVRLPMLAVFDQPDMLSSCGARGQSVHALQALTLMNSDFMLEQSRALAARVLKDAGTDPRRGIERLYTLALARAPRANELAAAERFLRNQKAAIQDRLRAGEPVTRLKDLPGTIDPALAAAWADLCLATLNMNEFVYLK